MSVLCVSLRPVAVLSGTLSRILHVVSPQIFRGDEFFFVLYFCSCCSVVKVALGFE